LVIKKIKINNMEEQVKEFVYENYKSYKDKMLIIEKFDSHWTIKRHKDESPLILSKDVV
jgi:hypothetical protein